jgi:hypothetical protein
MRKCGGRDRAGRLAALAFLLSVAGGAAPAAAASLTLPLDVEFDDGVVGDFGTVFIEERSHGKLAITISLTGALGPDADLHEFYFNLADDLDIDRLVLSHARCMGSGDDGFGSCKTDFDLEEDPSVRGGAGSSFDYGVNFGNGSGSKGNGQLLAATFKLTAYGDEDDDDDDNDKGKGKAKGKGKHDDDDDDDGERIPLTIADLLESSETRRGIEVFFAAHVQDTDLVPGSDSETVGALVPEPGTAALFGLGLAGIALLGRRRS